MRNQSYAMLSGLRTLVILTALVCDYSCSGKPKESDAQITVELEYIVFACGDDCPKWVPVEVLKQYPNDDNDAWYNAAVNIKPFESANGLPDTLGWNGDMIEFTGNFDSGRDVFYYSSYTVIESHRQ